jgi:hypothetical protein
MLVVLDSMGYDAANVSGFLAPDSRGKLGDMLRMALVDEAHSYENEGIRMVCRGETASRPETPANLTILLQPAPTTHFEHNVLTLAPVKAGQIGVARLCTKKTPYELEASTLFDLPRQAQPDPTIAGMVDFVLSEAKYAQKKQQN